MTALLELDGVGVPTASTLLYCAFPDHYPILDVRALESLGVKPRSQYPLSFWLGYLARVPRARAAGGRVAANARQGAVAAQQGAQPFGAIAPGYETCNQRSWRWVMPPRGVKKGTKRARQYERIKESQLDRGSSEGRAEEIAARTVNKEKARAGESRTRSRTSTEDMSSGRRGGQRSGTNRQRGRTRDQLYNEARNLGIEGRSRMNKAQLQRAVDARK